MGQWWELLIKVQTGFTSFLNPLRTYPSICFATFSEEFGSCHKSGPPKNKKKEPPWLQNTVAFQSQSPGGLGSHNTTYCAATNTMRYLSCVVQLGSWPPHSCLNICEMESDPKYDMGSQNCCSDCQTHSGARRDLPVINLGQECALH